MQSSILGRAREANPGKPGRPGKGPLIKISYYDPKEYTKDTYGRVDRRPYGGGPGMVLEPDGMLRAAEAALKKAKGKNQKAKVETIFFATDGAQFSEKMAKKMAKHSSTGTKHILLICGRYEGVDARVPKILKAKPITVGPYVLTGGELPAATLVDAISRFVPGVLGKAESLEASRVSSPEVYTRPEVLVWKGKKYKVPSVLLTGDHAKIEEWKQSKRKGIVQ